MRMGRVYGLLFAAVVVISFAAILIKWAQAPALVIATWRLGLASLALSPLALSRRRRRAIASLARRGGGWLLILSGLALALHFGAWILSLKYTSVASSVVLVTTNPLFVGLGAHFLLRERLAPALIAGILISVAGGVLIGYGDSLSGPDVLLGDALALLGALAASAYFLIGRKLRPQTDLGTYILVVYGLAALLLLGGTALSGQALLGYSTQTYLVMALLALGPQVFGHTTLNWALRYVSAAFVAVVILGEPLGATLLAYWLLGEGLTWLKGLGGGLILLGVYFAVRAEGRPSLKLCA